MTYAAAQRFCEWFSDQQQHPYRLATAKEWRAALGEQKISAHQAWLKGNSLAAPHLVGALEANENGFHDMIGNVEEWVFDSENPRGTTLGGSFEDDLAELMKDLSGHYDVAWQARDPQWPKSSWWMSDAGFVGFRIVTDSKP
jgi:formylglycine-generating enzyme required for sulfatase activity